MPPQDGWNLRIMAEPTSANNVVEIGTPTGYSGIWFGMVFQKTEGKLTTLESDNNKSESGDHRSKRS